MRSPLLLAVALLAAPALWAQVPPSQTDVDQDQQPLPPQPQTPLQAAGRPVESAAGSVGQRQTREDTTGVEPLGRLDSRISNRVQSRLRNRIDRYYDPRANAASPFAVAEEQTRAAGKRTRR